ncbi:MAG: YlbF family regulator [Clostridiales bacterium]|jgi:cell fate (sporulation/competence/biofilm development) regulator YlbF (YheA/YmcA/DUF963 family)|nr:YlbF family regulator [Clostridiales bacterium]
MDAVEAKLRELVEEIEKGSVYRDYAKALAAIGRDEPCLKRLRDFKRAETQYWQMGRRAMSFEEEKMLSYGYSELTLNEKIGVFLEKELALCNLLSKVYTALVDVAPMPFDEN